MCNIYICVGTYNIVRLALAGRRSTYGQCNTLLNDSPIISFDRIIFIYEQLKSREDTQIQTCSFFCHDSYVDSLLTSLETSILGEDKDMACPHVRDDRINGGMDKESGKKDRRILLVIGVVSLTLIMAVGVTMLFHFNDHHQLRKLAALFVVLLFLDFMSLHYSYCFLPLYRLNFTYTYTHSCDSTCTEDGQSNTYTYQSSEWRPWM